MNKIITIALREYRAMVGTKAFLVGVCMMPVLMMSGLIVPTLMKRSAKQEERTFAVHDGTDVVFSQLETALEQRNALVQKLLESGDLTEDQEDELRDDTKVTYVFKRIEDEMTLEKKLELSDQIRAGDLFAFVDIPADALDADNKEPAVEFVSEESALSDSRRWMSSAINEIVKANRLMKAGINPAAVAEASGRIPVKGRSLYSMDASGGISQTPEKDAITTLMLPFGYMMLMFMVILMAAQPMLESVLEEKSERIAEVLLGSASASQLMAGKLIGNVAGSLSVFIVYAAGAMGVAYYKGWMDFIHMDMMPLFLLFQLLGVLFFSSIFMSIGASVSQLKEAQSMLLPVWMLLMSPMMVWFNVIREPNGGLATGMSFFPPATPMMMTLRLSTGATIPAWQLYSSIALLVVATICCVIAAARIFQIGILWQGKTPKVTQLIRWVLVDPTKG